MNFRHNPTDEPTVEILEKAKNCTRKTETTDFVRYYGSGSTMDGKIFWENTEATTWDTYLGYRSLIAGMEKVNFVLFFFIFFFNFFLNFFF